MDDQLAAVLERLSRVETEVDNMKQQLNAGVRAWHFYLLLLVNLGAVLVAWAKH